MIIRERVEGGMPLATGEKNMVIELLALTHEQIRYWRTDRQIGEEGRAYVAWRAIFFREKNSSPTVPTALVSDEP